MGICCTRLQFQPSVMQMFPNTWFFLFFFSSQTWVWSSQVIKLVLLSKEVYKEGSAKVHTVIKDHTVKHRTEAIKKVTES